ncbi:restriction endonuclease subunit S [Anoxybacillus eryuanensis]|uniref:restriction endonuclease subunit S n=1 Tax=Anoxybacillus eryuanensis TaxID=651866 RepID=UPI003EF77908
MVSELSNNKIFKDIPSDWDVKFLGELSLSKPEYGANCPVIEYRHDYPRYVRITDISENGKLRSEDKKSIEPEEAENYLLNKGDIVFARSGATVGKTYLYNESDGPCAFAGYLIRFRPDSKRLLPEFLFQFTQSNWYKNWVKGMLRAGAQPNINGKEYASLPIPLPPIVEQYKIAAILSSVDEAIEKTEAIIEQTEEVKKGLMQQLLTKGIGHTKFKKTEIGEIPEGWEVKTFKEISVVRQGLQIPIAERFREPGKDRYVYITIQYLNNPDAGAEYIESPRSSVICNEDDVLMTRTGNTGQVVTNVHGVFHNNFFLIDYNREVIYKDYLVQFLNHEKTQQLIRKLAGTTTIPDLKHGDFYSIHVPIPPIQEQRKIATILKSVEDKVQKEKEKLAKLFSIKKGLMQVLLTGKVRVKVDEEVMSQ